MKTYNTYPYFDDFNESKNYHQILFKPEYAVQARELSQLQTILRSQIEKFGNHIFQHGSVVIPGNTYAEIGIPYFKVLVENNIDYTKYEGASIRGTTGISAKVKKVEMITGTSSSYWYFYFSYTGRVTIPNQIVTASTNFSPNETIFLDESTTVRISSLGTGSFANINDGVFYIDGSFVTVNKQSIVISRSDAVNIDKPSCHVVLKIDESIIDYNTDNSLLDNSRGFNNYAAPGADRVKITLTLMSLPLGSSFSDSDYVELMRYNQGVLEEHVRYSRYSELEKNLARRTFDESGNYVVNGFDTIIREHKKTNTNNGVYTDGDINKMVVSVTPGKAYIKGFETERISDSLITIDKARTPNHIIQKDTVTLTSDYGQYILATDLVNLPNISTQPEIKIYDGTPTNQGDLLGTARLLGIQKHLRNDSKPNETIYKFYISNVTLTNIKPTLAFGVIKTTTGTLIGTVVHRLSLSNLTTNFNSAITQFGDIRKIGIDANPWNETLPTAFSALVKAWDSTNNYLYVSKNSTETGIPRLYNGIGLIQYHDNPNSPVRHPIDYTATARIDEFNTVFSNNSPNSLGIPIFELPFSYINSIKNKDGSSSITYTIQDTIEVQVTNGVGQSGIINNVSVNSPTSDPDFFAISASGNTYISGITFVSSGQDGSGKFQINVATNITGLFKIIYSGVKTATHKTKKLESAQQIVTDFSSSINNTITLNHADVYEIESILEDGIDIKNKFIFNTGQTAYFYGNSYLKATEVITSNSLTIKYKYFSHSVGGDYFSVDSYQSLGEDFYSKIAPFSFTNRSIDLRRCLDFRPIVTAGENSLPKNGTKITIPVRIFVPRIDVVALEKSSGISVISGVPSETPIEPSISDDSIFIASLYIPPYTENASLVKIKTINNKVYTMSRIAKLEDRILKVEENMLLTELESSLINRDIIDASTGLSRFKSGYLVEDFSDPMYIADFYNENFSATYNDSFLRPAMERAEYQLEITYSDDVKVHPDGYITLPYIEDVWVRQNVSSHVTNVNPFNVFTWHGNLIITPAIDNSIETYKITEYQNVTTIRIPGPWIRWNFYNENGTTLELPAKFAGSVSSWETKDIVDYLKSIGAIDTPSGWQNTDVIIAGKQ